MNLHTLKMFMLIGIFYLVADFAVTPGFCPYSDCEDIVDMLRAHLSDIHDFTPRLLPDPPPRHPSPQQQLTRHSSPHPSSQQQLADSHPSPQQQLADSRHSSHHPSPQLANSRHSSPPSSQQQLADSLHSSPHPSPQLADPRRPSSHPSPQQKLADYRHSSHPSSSQQHPPPAHQAAQHDLIAPGGKNCPICKGYFPTKLASHVITRHPDYAEEYFSQIQGTQCRSCLYKGTDGGVYRHETTYHRDLPRRKRRKKTA